MKGLQVGAINVVLQPHSSEIYEKWFRAIFRLKLRASIFGNRQGAISQLYLTGEAEGIRLHGVISTFVDFDPTLPWFNEETYDDATTQDLGQLQLPDHLRPDHRRGNIGLDSKRHLVLFETSTKSGGLTPRQMLKFLTAVSSHPKIVSKFGSARLTVVPDSRAVDELLDWPALKKLTISTSLPNPDFADAAFSDIEEWLREQGAETFRQELGSVTPDLRPNEETKNVARIAAEHGFVEATGLNSDGRVVRRSTRSTKPLQHTEVYDPEVEPESTAFIRIASHVASLISRRRRSIGRVRAAAQRSQE